MPTENVADTWRPRDTPANRRPTTMKSSARGESLNAIGLPVGFTRVYRARPENSIVEGDAVAMTAKAVCHAERRSLMPAINTRWQRGSEREKTRL